MHDELVELAHELGIDDRAHLLGWRDDLPRFVAACDFVLVPSRWEGMPYIALEALAAARPVVATRVDGARALVEPGRTGFLADATPQSIAVAMQRALALERSELRAMGELGRQRVLAAHTLEHMLDRLLAVYREVA
jgi:glycosyltransferase involved in cell wall biosynthesis